MHGDQRVEYSPKTTTHASVIICAYTQERWNDLQEAVASVQQQTQPPHEIIVVVDHNPTLLTLAQKHLQGVRVLENQEERGLSGARNTGVSIAQGDYIAFLDDDAIASQSWLQSLEEALSSSYVMGVGGAVTPQWMAQEPAWFPEEFYWVVGCTYRGLPLETAPVRNPIGANMCIRREVFETIGGFRSGIGRIGTRPVGCEETEFCIRARQHWPERFFLYEPHANVYHRVPTSRANWYYFWARCYAEGISKAFVARFVGAKDTLSSESVYTLRTLPQGVMRNLGLALRKKRLGHLERVCAIIIGLAVTTFGYLVGRFFSQRNESKPTTRFQPKTANALLASSIDEPDTIP
ncbi:glycosyl transferase family 2 [Ktedonobacter racemifer DSM 44963]|uniref:Glycosyl transferase family 2 n=2 Tax=Ktedonobacter racemifer TaxID=363277 RepID=D6U598_KTERA|nr:glycosyl transferase family 2 [Ktedonobacter racemifer DSM 44963]